MTVEISIGEIVDKLSILQIKKNNIKETSKLINVVNEFNHLYDVVFTTLNIEKSDYDRLITINEKLWGIEDKLREKESIKSFDGEFIELARLVYFTNDKRAEIKKEINIKYGSNFVEEKNYIKYEDIN
tara:strand:- start:4327 stop:4710 length:384 start_codon:yes stop_codon:yes gene_type:complete